VSARSAWLVTLALGVAHVGVHSRAWSEAQDPAPPARPGEGADAAVEARALAAQLEAERRVWQKREAELLARVAALEAELATELERRLAREQEWLEFSGAVGALGREAGVALPGAAPAEALREPPAEPAPDPAAAERAARRESSQARCQKLRALLAVDGDRALDLLDVGALSTHAGRSVTGPVVARLVDGRGRLVGGLFAERLHVEVSRAARTVTLVFDDGYETRGGAREPFEPGLGTARGGVRRIALSGVDPLPWLEGVPELIDPDSARGSLDDGTRDLVALRAVLNELLRAADAEDGSGWRCVALGGVVRSALHDVQFIEQGARGQALRRVFADRLEVALEGRTVVLQLTRGAQERAGRVAPFLDGRFRIVLPRADAQRWRAAEVPGLAPAR